MAKSIKWPRSANYPAQSAKRQANKAAQESEEDMHRRVCLYLHKLRLHDDELHFNTDLSGIRMSKGVAGKVKDLRSQPGWPDLEIMRPGCGLLRIELKRDGVKLRNRKGLWSDDHVAEQAYILRELRANGAKAVFAIGYAEAVAMINAHLAGEDVNQLSKHSLA